MSTETVEQPKAPVTIKDLQTENPRWCAGCGDFGIIMGLKRFIVERQLAPAMTMNVSGIGCSGRAPNYFNTYGVHSIHGRAVTVATGLARVINSEVVIGKLTDDFCVSTSVVAGIGKG
jgi:2-oxoglutarate ferredoxin oxidoreductase subunit beta